MDRIFLTLNLANFTICASMALIDPFFPPYAVEQGIQIKTIGLIIAIHPLFGLIGSLKSPSIVTEQNRAKILATTQLVQTICSLLFVITYIFKNGAITTILALLSRSLNGLAYSFFITAFYSHIPLLYPDSSDQKIFIAETVSALGFVFSPVFGSLLYSIAGFIFPFIVYSCISFSCAIFIYYLMIKSDSELIVAESEKSEKKLDLRILCKYEIIINFLIVSLTSVSITIFHPLLALYLQKNYQIHSNKVGFFMALQPISYTIMTVFITLMQLNSQKSLKTLIGAFTNGFFLLFFGPDLIFITLEKNFFCCCFSLIITGAGQAFPILYSIPQLSAQLQRFHENQDECNIVAAAIFSSAIQIGEFTGPIIAGLLQEYFELERIASLAGIAVLISCICYLPFERRN